MKKTGIICVIAATALFAAGIPSFADLGDAGTTDMLTSGPWKFTRNSGGWESVRVFYQDGTFKTPSMANEHGHWKISSGSIVLTFADGHKDTLTLPLNPRGTPAFNAHGQPLTAVLQNAAVTALQPLPTPSPSPTPKLAGGFAGAHTEEDLRAAIVKYAYSWEHDKTNLTIKFVPDGTD